MAIGQQLGFGASRMRAINLWLSLFLALALITSQSHARPSSVFFPSYYSVHSGNDSVVTRTQGRSLAAGLDDYSDPSANRGHDPRNHGKKNP